jgi:hypothetical protein
LEAVKQGLQAKRTWHVGRQLDGERDRGRIHGAHLFVGSRLLTLR